MGMAILDNYRVTWEGSKDTVSIYINMYDYGVLKAPVGFSIKK
jgi:phosphatidylserine decarboxylase